MGIDRIDRTGPQGPDRLTTPTTGKTARTGRRQQPRAASDVAPPEDAIDLSAAARELAAAPPEAREDLVRRLRTQVQAGAYRVDPDAVAQHMVTRGDL